jgi:PadR family transcriptional regulator, regulatory protein AphA
MELSKTAYVVLGMLRLGRRTGYEIKSLVDISTRFFWAASYGQIYPELKRLEEAGLVTGTDDDSDGRRRRAYELTAAGERALHDWLTSTAPLSLELRHEGALKLFFADALDTDEQLALIRATRTAHERARDELRAFHPDAEPGPEKNCPRRVLEWGIELNDFYVDWCSRVERDLETEGSD